MSEEVYRKRFTWGRQECEVRMNKEWMEHISTSNEQLFYKVVEFTVAAIKESDEQNDKFISQALSFLDQLTKVHNQLLVSFDIQNVVNALQEALDIHAPEEVTGDGKAYDPRTHDRMWQAIANKELIDESHLEVELMPLKAFERDVQNDLWRLCGFCVWDYDLPEVKFLTTDGEEWHDNKVTIGCYTDLNKYDLPTAAVYHSMTRYAYYHSTPRDIAYLLYGAAQADIQHLMKPVSAIQNPKLSRASDVLANLNDLPSALSLDEFANEVSRTLVELKHNSDDSWPKECKIHEIRFVDDHGEVWTNPPGSDQEEAMLVLHTEFKHASDPLHPHYSSVYQRFTREAYAKAIPREIACLFYGMAIVDVNHLRDKRNVKKVYSDDQAPTSLPENRTS